MARLNIDHAELHSASADTLATRHNCSTRTIKRLREALRAKRDPATAAHVERRTNLNNARRAHKKRQRANAVNAAIVSAIIPATIHTEPVAPRTPAPPAPALLPARKSSAVKPSFDFESFAFLAALPQAVRYFQYGGSIEYLFDHNDHSELLVNLIDGELETWLVKFTHATITDEMVRTTFDALDAHPSTIAYALHPPDGAHTGVHMHIISVKSDPSALYVLQHRLNAHPATQKVRDVKDLASYLDISYKAKNYCIRYAQGGVHFGPAAPPEFRVICSAYLLHTRVTQRSRLYHIVALAKYLCDRLHSIAGVPVSWRTQVVALFAEHAHVIERPHDDEAHVPNLFLNVYLEAGIAWAATLKLCAATTPPPPPYLAHAKYYAALQSFYDRHWSYSNETRGERASRRARVIDIIRRQNGTPHVDSQETITGYVEHPDYFRCLRSERFAGQLLTLKLLCYGLPPRLPVPTLHTVPPLPPPNNNTQDTTTLDALRQRMAAAVSRL